MAYIDEILADGPFAYVRMEGPASPIAGEIGGRNLTVSGGSFQVPGQVGNAVHFNGTSDYGSLPLDLSDTPTVTFECWLNLDAYTGDNGNLAEFASQWQVNAGSFVINLNNTVEPNTISVGFGDGTNLSRWTIPNAALTTDEWHHFVVRMNRTANLIQVFVDGVEVATTNRQNAATPGNFANATLYLMTAGPIYTPAGLDELAVYKTLLSDARIAAHHAASQATGATVEVLHSGGSGNDDGSASLGGASGDLLAASPNALFSTPTNAQRLAGMTDYRCVYLRNASADALADVRVWVQTPSSETDLAEAIGEDTANPAQVIASATTPPAGVGFASPSNYATGAMLGTLAPGATIPLWVRRDVTAVAAPSDVDFVLGVSWTGAPGDELIEVSYTIVAAATLYVDADHPDADDSRTRAEAIDDPDLPFATMQAAALLLEAGDTMQVEPSTLGNANPSDPFDPDVYDGCHHLRNVDGSDVLPSALNGGNEPINVIGHIVDGVRPKVRRLEFRELDNWHFANFQRGYDVGSGHDHNTANVLHNCKDLVFTNLLYTGGGNYCNGARGVMRWLDFICHSPYGGSGDFLDGAGFHVRSQDTSTGIRHPVVFWFEGGHFEGIEGEDCIQTGLGAPESEGYCYAINNTFQDIVQSQVTGAPHTDCMQSLGGAGHVLVGNRYFNCSLPFIASDNENGRIVVINNLVDEDCFSGFHGQGTREWVVAHNTILGTGIGIAFGNRLNTTIPGFEQHVVCVNNLANDLDIASGAILAGDSVIENNVLTREPGLVTEWGTQLAGLPELGSTARLVAAGITGNYELATTPAISAGVGGGRSLSGLGLTAEELEYAESDLLGRPYTVVRDVGCLQSSAAVEVDAAPRAPYVLDPSPTGEDVPLDANVTVRLFPRPGATIDSSTVTMLSAYVTDVRGVALPAVVTLSAPDGDGYQTITLDLLSDVDPTTEGQLLPLVLYTAQVTDAITDTDGSAVVPTSWSFRAAGPTGPGISGPGGTGLDAIRPTVQMVADLVRVRVVHEGAQTTSVQTFDTTTFPTDSDVERLIEQGTNAIWTQVPGSLAAPWPPAAQHLAALYTAILIETSYYREQLTDDMVSMYRDLLTSGIKGLGASVSSSETVASRNVDTIVMRSVMTMPWEQQLLLDLPEVP